MKDNVDSSITADYMTFSNSPAYLNPNFRIFSPPTVYNAPNPPTPTIDAGISDIFSSVEEEIVDGAGGGGNVTCPFPVTLQSRYLLTMIAFSGVTVSANDLNPPLSCGGKNNRI